MGIELCGKSTFFHHAQPTFVIIVLAPGIEEAAFRIDSSDDLAKLPVTAGQYTFQYTCVRFMPIVFDALLI